MIFLLIICSCNDSQPINAKNCEISYSKKEAIISVDTVITFDPATFAEEMWVFKYYFEEDEIETIICSDTLKNEVTQKSMKTFGTIYGDHRNYLLKEKEYVLLSPGMREDDPNPTNDCGKLLNDLHFGWEARKKMKVIFAKTEGDYWNKTFVAGISKDDYCWITINENGMEIPIKSSDTIGGKKQLLISDGGLISISIEYWPIETNSSRKELAAKIITIVGSTQDTCKYNNIVGYYENNY